MFAQEKNIEKEEVFGAMELALEKAARVKYGLERDIRVKINRETGDISLNSYLKVVDVLELENQKNQILYVEAKKKYVQIFKTVNLLLRNYHHLILVEWQHKMQKV